MTQDEHKFKTPSKTKRWSFGFYFLLLASYNNLYCKYEHFLIIFLLIGVKRHYHNKRY
jgi:hypothetical protein